MAFAKNCVVSTSIFRSGEGLGLGFLLLGNEIFVLDYFLILELYGYFNCLIYLFISVV